MTKPKPVPKDIQKWSWTAVLAPMYWTFDNKIKTYPESRGGLPRLGPFIFSRPFWQIRRYGLIYLGRNGNKLAWRARDWESVEQFLAFQKRILIKSLLADIFWIALFIGIPVLLAYILS